MIRTSLRRHQAPAAPSSGERLEDTQDIGQHLVVDGTWWLHDSGSHPPFDEALWHGSAEQWVGGFTPVVDTSPARVWVSAPATLGLIVGVVAACASISGIMAPEGLVLGVAGLLLGIAGLISAGRPGMAGQGVAGIGVAFAVAAVALALVAMSGRYAWLDSGSNAVGGWHAWLAHHWPWLYRWS